MNPDTAQDEQSASRKICLEGLRSRVAHARKRNNVQLERVYCEAIAILSDQGWDSPVADSAAAARTERESTPSLIFYFGPIGKAGHYLWRNERQSIWHLGACNYGISQPLVNALDGAFCPGDSEHTEGQRWLCSIVPPWTIVAWWDRSLDTRPNCVSVFIGKDFGNQPHKLLEEAKPLFPSVFARQPRELKEFEAK